MKKINSIVIYVQIILIILVTAFVVGAMNTNAQPLPARTKGGIKLEDILRERLAKVYPSRENVAPTKASANLCTTTPAQKPVKIAVRNAEIVKVGVTFVEIIRALELYDEGDRTEDEVISHIQELTKLLDGKPEAVALKRLLKEVRDRSLDEVDVETTLKSVFSATEERLTEGEAWYLELGFLLKGIQVGVEDEDEDLIADVLDSVPEFIDDAPEGTPHNIVTALEKLEPYGDKEEFTEGDFAKLGQLVRQAIQTFQMVNI